MSDAPSTAATITRAARPDPTHYDMGVVGLSGKDGRAAMHRTLEEFRAAGVADRVYTAHADLGLVEWPSVTHEGIYYPSNRELVELEATHYGIPPDRQIYTRRVVTDPDGLTREQTLLEYTVDRQKWADPARRYCTSDTKITKIDVALTPRITALRRQLGRPVRILNITGMRADESDRRADLPVYAVKKSNRNAHIDNYLPVHAMSTPAVQELVDSIDLPHHWAYDSQPGATDWQGMSRLSCSLCIMSNKRDLVLAVRRRPRLAALYLEVEDHLRHRVQKARSMRSIIDLAARPGGPDPGVVLDENTPEFDAFAAAVRSRMRPDAVPLRGGTEFGAPCMTHACGTGCGPQPGPAPAAPGRRPLLPMAT